MKILLTGASGFIGKSLIKKLRNKHAIGYIPHKLLYTSNLKIQLSLFKPDIIIHAAAYGNMSWHAQDKCVIKNVTATQNLLEASKDIDYKLFINFGSSSEYGHTQKRMREDQKCNPQSPYAISKLTTTLLTDFYAKKYNKKNITVRPFSIYGPGEDNRRLIPTLINALRRDIAVNLDGFAYHDWVYIDDLVSFIDHIIRNSDLIQDNIYNIGTGIQTTNAEVLTKIETIVGKKAKINGRYGTTQLGNWRADISLSHSVGFKCGITLDSGLKKTVDYYLKNSPIRKS